MVGRKKTQPKKAKKKTVGGKRTTKPRKASLKPKQPAVAVVTRVTPVESRVGHQKVAVILSLIGLALGGLGLFGLASMSLFFDTDDAADTQTNATGIVRVASFSGEGVMKLKDGFPAALDSVPATTGAVFDMNGDGSLEIVQGTSTGCVYVFSADGSTFNSKGSNTTSKECTKANTEDPWPLQLSDTTTIVGSQPKPAQLDDDADIEFVIGTWKEYGNTTSDAKLYALNSDGTQVWADPISCGTYCTSPTVLDVNGDGKDELFFSTNSDSNSAVQVIGIASNGTTLAGWPKQINDSYAIVSVEDMTGNGSYGVFVSTGSQVYSFDVSGKARSGWPQQGSSIALGNVMGDQQKEVVTFKKGDPVEDGLRFAYELLIYDMNGNRQSVSGWNHDTLIASADAIFIPVLANLDGVGPYEIVVADTESNLLHAFYGDGSLLYGWPQHVMTSVLPTIGDLNSDGRVEVITSVSLNGVTQYTAFTRDGTLVPGFPFSAVSDIFQPLNADLDGDGTVEFLFPKLWKDADGSIACGLLAAEIQWDSTKLVDAQGAAGWRMWGRDSNNSFRYTE